MLLQNEALEDALRRSSLPERLIVTPLLERSKQVGESSIDVRLGTEFLIVKRTYGAGLDPGSQPQVAVDETHERLTVELGQAFWLHPQQFVLGATLEYIRIPNWLGGYVIGRSSWGRVGLLPATAIMIQPGFTGNLTLELVNEGQSPIALYPGSRIAQLALHTLQKPTAKTYTKSDSKYQAPIGPQAARLSAEKNEIDRVRVVADALARRHHNMGATPTG